jgi:hypothetical protein
MSAIVHLNEYSYDDILTILVRGTEFTPSIKNSKRYYPGAMQYLPERYAACLKAKLRFECTTNTLRDTSGWLSRPSDPSVWGTASRDDAAWALARNVWCNAVREFNRANM